MGIEVSSWIKESPAGAFSNTPAKDFKKARYSDLPLGALAQTTSWAHQLNCRCREATLLSTGESSNTQCPRWGAKCKLTPARCLSPWAMSGWNKVQPFSRNLVLDPMMCVEVSPVIYCWYLSTSCTISGSFPARNYILCPWREIGKLGSEDQGPCLRSLSMASCTYLLWPYLQVMGPQEGNSMLLILAEPDQVSWTETCSTGTHQKCLAPGWNTGNPQPGNGH